MAKETRNFTVSARTTASADQVFALVADSTTWPQWTPIRQVVLTNLAPDGSEQVGTLRSFHIGVGRSVEEVTGLFPGKRFSYSLRKGMPISDHVASIELEPTEAGCVISWYEAFTPTVVGTGAFFEWFLRAFIGKCLNGLVKASES